MILAAGDVRLGVSLGECGTATIGIQGSAYGKFSWAYIFGVCRGRMAGIP